MRWLFVLILTLVALFAQAQSVSAVVLQPPHLTGGSACYGLVTLTSAAPASGVSIKLASGNPTVASVPASVNISGGAWSAKFLITTTPVSEDEDVKITATDGGSSRSNLLEVQAPILTSLVFTSPSVIGGASSTARLTLDGPAPAGGVTFVLISSSPAVTVPENVVVPKNSTSVTFRANTTKVGSITRATITAVSVAGWLTSGLIVGNLDFANPSFESPLLQANTWEAPGAPGSSWTYNEPGNAYSGQANGSGSWGTNAHSGAQYAFVQAGSSIQQTVSGLVVGQKYTVQFWMATRSGDVGANAPAPMVVTANGTSILGPTSPGSASWAQYTTSTFTATSTSYTFVFKSNTGNGDSTDLLDDIHLLSE